MIGIEKRRTAHTLFRTGDEQAFLLIIVFEIGSGVVNRVGFDIHRHFGIFREQVCGLDEEAARLRFDNHLSLVINSDHRQRVALTCAINRSTAHLEATHIIHIFVEVFHDKGSLLADKSGIGGLLLGSGEHGLLLHASKYRLREEFRIVKKGIVRYHTRKSQVDRIFIQYGFHVRFQSCTFPGNRSSFCVKHQFIRVITSIYAAHNQTVFGRITPEIYILEIKIGFFIKAKMIREAHGYPFDIISLIHNVIAKETLIELHLALEESGAMTDMVIQNFLPVFGFASILTLQKGAICLDKALKMRNGAVFFLHHLVGFLNKNGLVVLIHLGSPHQLKLFQNLLGLLLSVFGYRRIELLHLLHGFGRVFRERRKTLSLS